MLSKYLKTLGNGFGMWIALYRSMENKKENQKEMLKASIQILVIWSMFVAMSFVF